MIDPQNVKPEWLDEDLLQLVMDVTNLPREKAIKKCEEWGNEWRRDWAGDTSYHEFFHDEGYKE